MKRSSSSSAGDIGIDTADRRGQSRFGRWFGSVRRLPLISLVILVAVLIAAIFAPMLAPYDLDSFDLSASLQPPAWMEGGSSSFLLGADNLGHDIFSRILYGARVSLLVGFLAVGLAGTFGTVLGLVAGYFGGWVDGLIMRVVDIMMSVPSILLALILAAAIGPGLTTVIIVIIVVYWTYYARLVRGEVLAVKALDFIALAHVVGCGNIRILLRHILPNIVNSIIVLATVQLGAVIVFEATLSFLGLGVQPPTPAWGSMLADGRTFVGSAWWLSVFPGLAIMLTVLSMNMFGDWLRDHWDPKRRRL
jgi:peptide/nickel transport system permease protein